MKDTNDNKNVFPKRFISNPRRFSNNKSLLYVPEHAQSFVVVLSSVEISRRLSFINERKMYYFYSKNNYPSQGKACFHFILHPHINKY